MLSDESLLKNRTELGDVRSRKLPHSRISKLINSTSNASGLCATELRRVPWNRRKKCLQKLTQKL